MPYDPNQLDNAIATDPTIPTDDTAAAAQSGWSTPTVTPKAYFVGHRKMLDVCCSVDPANGVAAAEWVGGALKAQVPTTYDVYYAGTDSAGSNGGLDVSNPATVAFVNQLVAASAASIPPGKFTAAMGNAVIALGQVSNYRFGGPVAAADVTASRARVARSTTIMALLTKIDGAKSAFLSGKVNPAANDPTKPVPTWADYQAAVAAEA